MNTFGILPKIATVIRAVRDKQGAFEKAVPTGLKAAALVLQRKSQELVPVQYGILKRSAETVVEGTGLKTTAKVRYSASYALYVHENLDVAHGIKFNLKHADLIAAGIKPWAPGRGPNQTAKFLEIPATDKSVQQEMIQQVRRSILAVHGINMAGLAKQTFK